MVEVTQGQVLRCEKALLPAVCCCLGFLVLLVLLVIVLLVVGLLVLVLLLLVLLVLLLLLLLLPLLLVLRLLGLGLLLLRFVLRLLPAEKRMPNNKLASKPKEDSVLFVKFNV